MFRSIIFRQTLIGPSKWIPRAKKVATWILFTQVKTGLLAFINANNTASVKLLAKNGTILRFNINDANIKKTVFDVSR